jgi:nicotinamidase-related amidase
MHNSFVPDWADARGRLMARFPPMTPRRTAVLVIDMQKAFIAEGEPFANPNAQDIVANVNRIVGTLREASARIYWSRQTTMTEGPGRTPEWQLFEGSLPSLSREALMVGAPGREIDAMLDVAPGDLVFDKYRYSAFVNAAIDLDARLRADGIEDVVVIGTITNCCCESTARDAVMRDYRVTFVSDATAAATDEEHNATLLSMAAIFGRVIETDALLALLPLETV